MVRFKDEFIFIWGEYHFITSIDSALSFIENFFNENSYSCCSLCAGYPCHGNCILSENLVLIQEKYLKAFKDGGYR